MKAETARHLENLKNPEYAEKHKQKMISYAENTYQWYKNHPEKSGSAKMLARNLETCLKNIETTKNAPANKITWY